MSAPFWVLEDPAAAHGPRFRNTSPPAGGGEVMEPINWDDAPLDTALWGVYGPDCFPTVFACKLHHASGYGRAIWGFSVYRRKPGFRTLGEGREWADRHKLRLFASREAAFAHIASLFGKAK